MQIAENRVITMTRASVSAGEAELGYLVRNRAAIDENWAREKAANPALYNGPMFLAETVRLKDGVLQARYDRADFATLLHWRSDRSPDRPWHIFGIGVVVSSDNCLVAARMAMKTAMAGRVYFPAGSVDVSDITGGKVDYAASMRREVHEETGLDLSQARPESGLHLVTAGHSVALFRRYYFPLDAAQLATHIRAHIEAENDPELDDAVVISSAGQMGDETPSYVRAFADWHFSEG